MSETKETTALSPEDSASDAKEAVYGLSSDLIKSIDEALEEKDKPALKELISDIHVADVADYIDSANHDNRRQLIEFIRDDFDPEILVEIASSVREEIIDLLGTKSSANAIIGLETDDAVDVIEDLREENQQELLEAIPDEQRAELEEGLAYPEDSAGRLLEKGIVSVPEFWTVGQTIDHLRKTKDIPQDFYEVFVVDPKLKPVGGVLLSRMMQSNRNVKMNDLMETDIKLIHSGMDQEEVAFIFRQYGLVSAPVINDDGRMIGVISIDDVVNVIEEEAEEDIMRLGGVRQDDFHTGSWVTMKRRFPWLLVNLFTAIAASIVIGLFEDSIQRLAALAVLMPIVASMGGNAGTQTLTVAVRAIATRELTGTNALRVVSKEILVGTFNGMAFAVVAGAASYIWYDNLLLSIILALATIVTLVIAGLSGALIPLGLTRAGVDPAIASSVVLTTITDIVGFGLFLWLGAMILL
jgi:magnesium transporter